MPATPEAPLPNNPEANLMLSFERLVAKLVAEKTAKDDAAAKKMAKDAVKKDAKKYADSIISKNKNIKSAAEQRAIEQAYPKERIAVSRDEVKATEVVDRAPQFVKDAVSANLQAVESPAVAEFVIRMSELPPELQQDPHVIVRETTRLYHSVNWLGNSLTDEGYREAMRAINASYAEAQRLAADQGIAEKIFAPGTDFIEEIDSRFDLYKTKRLDPIPEDEQLGDLEPPKRANGTINREAGAQYKEWADKKGREIQRKTMENTLLIKQRKFDSLADTPKDLLWELRNYSRELERGLSKTNYNHNLDPREFPEDKNPRVTTDTQLHPEAMEVFDRVNAEIAKLSKEVDALYQLEKQAKAGGGFKRVDPVDLKMRREAANPPTVTRAEAKGKVINALSGKELKEFEWLGIKRTGRTIRLPENPDSLLFIEKVLTDEAMKDPKALSTETLKLVYSTGGLSPEIRTEVAEIVKRVRGKMADIITESGSTDFSLDDYDVMLYGKPLGEPPEYPGDILGPVGQAITDPKLIHEMREFVYKIKSTPRFADDFISMNKSVQSYLSKLYEGEVPVEQTREAVSIIDRMLKNATEKQTVERANKQMVFWRDIKHIAPNQELHPDDMPINLRGFSEEEIELVKMGKEGLDEWFSNFVFGIYGIGHDKNRPELPEIYKFNTFEDLLIKIYGEGDGKTNILRYRAVWNDQGRQEYLLKTLAFEPADIKDKVGALRRIMGSDLDQYTHTHGADVAINMYEHTIKNFFAEQQTEYNRAVKFLDTEVTPFWNSGERLTNYEYFLELRKRAGVDPNSPFDPENPGLLTDTEKTIRAGEKPADRDTRVTNLENERKIIMEKIRVEYDKVSAGTGMKDENALSYHEAYVGWASATHRLSELEAISRNPEVALTREERKLKRELPDLIKKRKEQYLLMDSEAKAEGFLDGEKRDLEKYAGYSPIESEVRERMVGYITANKKEMSEFIYSVEDFGPNAMDNPITAAKIEAINSGEVLIKEWKVRDAIFASRMFMVASGRMVDLNSFAITRPLDLKGKYPAMGEGLSTVKSIMWSYFMEDLVRIYNPELFRHRFGMGGGLGDRAADILGLNLMLDKGYGTFDGEGAPKYYTKTKEWKDADKDFKGTKQAKLLRKMMEVAEQNLGISMTEIIRPGGFFHGGGAFDGSSWRLEVQFDEIKHRFMKKFGPDAPKMWENQAMGIQYLVANDMEKKQILHRMMDRTPSVFFTMMSGEEILTLREKYGMTGEDGGKIWKNFERSLSMAETDMWKNHELLKKDISLTSGGKDFGTYVGKYMNALGMDGAQIRNSEMLIRELRDRITAERGGKSLIDHWVKHKFPITLSTADLDWKETNFFQLGTAMLDRRGRDNVAMAQTRDGIYQLLTDWDLLCPEDPKETLKLLKEIRSNMNAYAGPQECDLLVKNLARVIIDVNRNRAINPFVDGAQGLLGWLPGAQFAMKQLAEADFRGLKNIKFMNRLTGGKWGEFWTKYNRLEHLPHSVAEVLSVAIKYKGAEANAWDEYKIAGFITAIQEAGLFQDEKSLNFHHDLRNEFKASLFWRSMFAVPRKYWWVVPTATISLALMKGLDEEEKKSEG
ncbi:hypothetical protein ACFL1A_01610 [Patescibacteria group bacterium]